MTATEYDTTPLAEYLTPDEWEGYKDGRIVNDDGAKWALRKLGRATDEMARITADADAEIDRIKRWRDDALATPNHDARFFRGLLIAYRRHLEAEDPKLPLTYKTSAGSLTRRGGRPSVKVTEADAFVAWAKTNAPDAIKSEPRVSAMANWPRVEKDGRKVIVAPESGEVVPGVEVQVGEDTYDAKPEQSVTIHGGSKS